MDKDSLREQLEEYVELISRIRVLSAVQMEAGSKAEEYGKCLREDYQEIGSEVTRNSKGNNLSATRAGGTHFSRHIMCIAGFLRDAVGACVGGGAGSSFIV